MGQFLQSRAVYLRDTRTNKDPFLLVGPMQFENKACISMIKWLSQRSNILVRYIFLLGLAQYTMHSPC